MLGSCSIYHVLKIVPLLAGSIYFSNAFLETAIIEKKHADGLANKNANVTVKYCVQNLFINTPYLKIINTV